MSVSKKGYFAAFSIMESVVGMVLTAMVMGIIFMVFSIMSERMIDFKEQNTAISDLNRLTYAINKDIFDLEIMSVTDRELTFTGYSGEKVVYSAATDYILRTSETFTDTLRLSLDKIAVDSVKSQSQKNVFQKLTLGYVLNGGNMELKFYKRVYPDQLLLKLSANEP
jgi:hypothetical protein